MMVETSEGNSIMEDSGSIISSMGMGRGSVKVNQDKLLAKIGLGRGKTIRNDL